jgi:hypothetical protein
VQSLVTIARFNSTVAAQVARSALEARGIRAFLTNEIGSTTLGGPVELQVSEDEAETAHQLLVNTAASPRNSRGVDTAALPIEQQERCIICQAAQVEQVRAALPLRVLGALVTMVIPLPAEWFQGSKLRCGLCRHEWRPER